MPHSLTTFVSPERRITSEMRKRLEQLAPLFLINIDRKIEEGQQMVELSGAGFSEGQPLVLNANDAPVRLLAEICSTLTRWIPFNLWEPCEVTLFALPPERIERCAATFRKQHAAQVRAMEKAATAKTVQAAVELINNLKK